MEPLSKALEGARIGAPSTHRNLTMFPILDGGRGEPGYLVLDEAFAAGCVRVTEVSESGSVPELRLVNNGTLPVFLMDGEELVGAKQNRVLNLSILAPAGKTLIIPVSCVEQGRWRHTSDEFAAAPRVHFAQGRAKRTSQVFDALRMTGTRHSNQAEVWSDVACLSERLGTRSPTMAMADIYEGHRTRVEDFVRAFPAATDQTGALFAIDGRVIGLDLFDSADTLRKLLPKIVRSYALDAIDGQHGKQAEAPPADAAGEFLRGIGKAREERFSAVGLGQDLRLTGEGLVGAALESDGRIVHLSAFRLESSNGTKLSRASMRRRNLRMD